MNNWSITIKKGFICKEPIFLEGLPGIGNVGKIVIDYLIDELKAKKVGTFFSYDLPNSVFVNEKNMVQLPKIELYHLYHKNKDYLFLTGDAQPAKERASYEFTKAIITLLKSFNCKQIITLGGIGLEAVPEVPDVFVTGSNKSLIKEFVSVGANPKVFGVVGPIIGVSGLLLGLAKQEKIPAIVLLGETFGHPMYIGLKEARLILVILNKKFSFKIDFKELDEEIAFIQEELDQQESNPEEISSKKRTKKMTKLLKYKDLNYIG